MTRKLATVAGLVVLHALVAGLRACVELLDGMLMPAERESDHNFQEGHQRRPR